MNENENEGVLGLVEMLYNMVSEAWTVPLGNDRCLIDRDKALDIIEEIKAQLPSEMADARRLYAARQEFIDNAKREAESVRKMAEERSRKMLEEQEVVRRANRRAEEIIAKAEEQTDGIRKALMKYIDEALRGTEESVAGALSSMQNLRARFRDAAAQMEAEAAAPATPADPVVLPAVEEEPEPAPLEVY